MGVNEPASTAIRILIADDHPIFREGLKMLLRAAPDIEIVGEAADGAQAIAMARELKPDIVLLDLAMPLAPGLEVLRALTVLESGLRVLLLTASIEKAELLLALQLGARGVVLKALTSELLLKAIRAVMADEYWVDRESIAELIDAFRHSTPGAAEAFAHPFGLTTRELEVVAAVVAGLTNREAGDLLSLSEQTVKRHVTNIFDKTGTSSRLELGLFAVRHGLVQPGVALGVLPEE